MSPPTTEAPPHTGALGLWARFTQPMHTLRLRADGLHEGPRRWASFQAWCQDHPGQRCTLLLGAAWLHEALAAAALPLADDAAALAWAAPLLQHYHGEAASTWPLAAWQAGRRRGTSALHGLDLAALQATATAHQVQLTAVAPEWQHRLRHTLTTQPALGNAPARLLLQEPGWVSVLDLHHGQLLALQLRRWPEADALAHWQADTGTTWVCASNDDSGSVAQPLAAAPLAMGTHRLGWPSLLGPARGLHTANFLQPQRGVHRLAKPAAATALLVAGLAGGDAFEAWNTRADAQQALARATLQAAQRPATRAAAPHRHASGATTAALAAPTQANRLNRPWPQVFAALDAKPPPGVAWLGLQVADSGALRLQGLAPTTAAALAMADALGQQRGLAAVAPGRLESSPGGMTQFDVQAQAAPPWR